MRMHYRAAISAALIGLLVAGCGDNGAGTRHDGHAAGTKSSSSPSSSGPHNQADVTFAQQMIPHHRQAVAMAKLAPARAASDAVKKLAAQIAQAQGPEITTISRWLTGWGQKVPATMPTMGGMDHGSMPGMMSDTDMSRLATASGTAFDQQFLTMMITHHHGAITMASHETHNGKNAAAKALARSIATNQTTEIATMRDLLKNR